MKFLKQILLATIAILAFSIPAQCASPEADVKKVVETFYKDYLRFNNKPTKPAKGDPDDPLIAWLNSSPYASPGLKAAVKKAFVTARKRDPELGLESDPILAGQDYPKKGYRAGPIHVVKDKASVTMEGIDADPSFRIPLDLINVKGAWLIDRIDRIKAATK